MLNRLPRPRLSGTRRAASERAAQESAARRDSSDRRRRRIAMLTVLGLLSAYAPLSIDMYLPGLPSISRDLDASAPLVQLSITACLIGLAVGQLLAGPLSDRRGRRSVLLPGLTAYVVASVACGLAPTGEALVALRLVQGLAGSFGIVVARAILRDLYSGVTLSRVLSRLMLVIGVAPVLSPILGAQLLHLMSWRGTFYVLAGIGFAVLALTLALIPETLAAENRTTHRVRDDLVLYARIARDRSFVPYAAASGLFFGSLFAFISASPFVVDNVYHRGATLFSVVFAIVQFSMIAAGQANASLVGTFSTRALLYAGLAVATTASLAVLLVARLATGAGMWVLTAALVVALFPNGIVSPNAGALALENYAANAGAASALLGLLSFVIGALASPIVGLGGKDTAVPMGTAMLVCTAAALAQLALLDPWRARCSDARGVRRPHGRS